MWELLLLKVRITKIPFELAPAMVFNGDFLRFWHKILHFALWKLDIVQHFTIGILTSKNPIRTIIRLLTINEHYDKSVKKNNIVLESLQNDVPKVRRK